MNTLDIIIATLLVFGFVRGLIRGFFIEIASLIGLIAGVYGAIHFSFYIGNLLVNYVSWSAQTITIISFVLTFGVIVLGIALIGKMLTKIADIAFLGMLNKIFGGIFGLLKIAFILSFVLLVLSKLGNTIPFISEEQQEKSYLYNPIKNLAVTVFPSFVNIVDEKSKDFEMPAEDSNNF
jgi:membrane protein required for colicin V production